MDAHVQAHKTRVELLEEQYKAQLKTIAVLEGEVKNNKLLIDSLKKNILQLEQDAEIADKKERERLGAIKNLCDKLIK